MMNRVHFIIHFIDKCHKSCTFYYTGTPFTTGTHHAPLDDRYPMSRVHFLSIFENTKLIKTFIVTASFFFVSILDGCKTGEKKYPFQG